MAVMDAFAVICAAATRHCSGSIEGSDTWSYEATCLTKSAHPSIHLCCSILQMSHLLHDHQQVRSNFWLSDHDHEDGDVKAHANAVMADLVASICYWTLIEAGIPEERELRGIFDINATKHTFRLGTSDQVIVSFHSTNGSHMPSCSLQIIHLDQPPKTETLRSLFNDIKVCENENCISGVASIVATEGDTSSCEMATSWEGSRDGSIKGWQD